MRRVWWKDSDEFHGEKENIPCGLRETRFAPSPIGSIGPAPERPQSSLKDGRVPKDIQIFLAQHLTEFRNRAHHSQKKNPEGGVENGLDPPCQGRFDCSPRSRAVVLHITHNTPHSHIHIIRWPEARPLLPGKSRVSKGESCCDIKKETP